jgi:hypothetical protein
MFEQGFGLFLVILQDAVTSDRIAQCTSDEDIRRKMSQQGDARKSNGSR